ncbi:hypothetical protein NMK71_05480 [Weeksellaceae bacterium KMM 9713]|uniref:Uncharacterized protein n=1 Tax=Profundicola chukchiensis TaxID=2961959 RepID=A0A9X4MXD1_9FLAO|nr:hypothetical protein [Profundicola chukchiensis]MDG4945858.1 hypothetical protein [Profundicola chukchiensis]MDG4951284.1 hypothetical protein [Profundicola chukchiensis]
MKIKYNEIDKSIEIKDELRSHYLLLKIVMILNLISAVFQLLDINETGIGFIEIILFIVGIISLIILCIFIFKKSTSDKIPIEKIERLTKKSIFGKKQFSLKLKNGKKRDLTELKSETEFAELKKLFSEIGITN